jgi:hypothetical protein
MICRTHPGFAEHVLNDVESCPWCIVPVAVDTAVEILRVLHIILKLEPGSSPGAHGCQSHHHDGCKGLGS